jgi:uncharacterized alpha/beta hydrolase family protein
MAATVTIGGDGSLFVGEDKTFRLELLDVAGTPVDMSGWTILFDVRKKDTSPDPAIFSKTASVTGAYNSVRASNTQRAVVALTDTEMNTVVAKTYRYSWKRTTDGSETVLLRGDFKPEKATAP